MTKPTTIEEVLEHMGVGWCGNPFCDKPNVTVQEALKQLLGDKE